MKHGAAFVEKRIEDSEKKYRKNMKNSSNKMQGLNFKQRWEAFKKEWSDFWGNTSRLGKIVILIGIIFVPIAPWIFTREWGWGGFNSTTGAIGDTVGGITAPIVNLISAVLVYYAFQAQIKANKLVSDKIDEEIREQKISRNRDFIFKLFDFVKNEIYSFHNKKIKIDTKLAPESYRNKLLEMPSITGALFLTLWDYKKLNFEQVFIFNEIKNIIRLFEDLLAQANEIEIHKEDKKFLYLSLKHLHISLIQPGLALFSKFSPEKGEQWKEADPSFIVNSRTKIEKELDKIKAQVNVST